MRTTVWRVGAVALALLVGGCGGDETAKDGGAKRSGAPRIADPADNGELSGVWSARQEGKEYTLIIVRKSALMRWDKGLCDGQIVKSDARTELVLQCALDTDEGRDRALVEYLDARSLRLAWNGDHQDEYTRVAEAPAELPSSPDEVPGLEDKLKELPEEGSDAAS